MNTHVEFMLPDGKKKSYTVGEGEVTKMFTDEKTGNFVILTKEGIVVYSGIPYITLKEYKTNE